jgi:hypothetical protein
MAYDDFIYFMLSEEDKGSEARCVWLGASVQHASGLP